jgi:hypothetical protein
MKTTRIVLPGGAGLVVMLQAQIGGNDFNSSSAITSRQHGMCSTP